MGNTIFKIGEIVTVIEVKVAEKDNIHISIKISEDKVISRNLNNVRLFENYNNFQKVTGKLAIDYYGKSGFIIHGKISDEAKREVLLMSNQLLKKRKNSSEYYINIKPLYKYFNIESEKVL